MAERGYTSLEAITVEMICPDTRPQAGGLQYNIAYILSTHLLSTQMLLCMMKSTLNYLYLNTSSNQITRVQNRVYAFTHYICICCH